MIKKKILIMASAVILSFSYCALDVKATEFDIAEEETTEELNEEAAEAEETEEIAEEATEEIIEDLTEEDLTEDVVVKETENTEEGFSYNYAVGEAYYLDENGDRMTGWIEYKTSDNYTNKIYADKDGVLAQDWTQIDGKWYYFGAPSGEKYANIFCYRLNKSDNKFNPTVQIKGDYYYLDENGARQTGWIKHEYDASLGHVEIYYYAYPDGKLAQEWTNIDGNWYFFGYFVDDGNGSYYLVRPYMCTGVCDIKGELYYFDENGVYKDVTGWVKHGDYIWYYAKSDKSFAKGWEKINGKWYYFNSFYRMQTGLQHIDGKDYYLDDNGAMQTGWVQYANQWYYADQDGSLVNGWKKIDGNWYYFNMTMKRNGIYSVNLNYYYFDKDGAMQTGWVQYANQWYYADQDGSLVNGWKKIDGNWYYFVYRKMQTNWVDVGGKWYYFGDSGTMKTGWIQSGNKWYYLKSDGAMAAGEWVDGYWINEDGTWTYAHRASWRKDSKGWYYQDTSGWYAKKQWQTIDGKAYYFDESGYLVE